jgi:hypothetical protein
MADLPPIGQEDAQFGGLARGCALLGESFQARVHLFLGFVSHSLDQGMERRIVRRAPPFASQLRGTLIGAAHRCCKTKPVGQSGRHFLMGREPPFLALGAKPLSAAGLLTVVNFDLYGSDAALEGDRSLLPTHQRSGPEGKKKD